jgi:hypothetical protein
MSIRTLMEQIQSELAEGGKGKYQHAKRGKSGKGYPNIQADKPGYGPSGKKRDVTGDKDRQLQRQKEAEKLRRKGKYESVLNSDSLLLYALTEDAEMLEGIVARIKKTLGMKPAESAGFKEMKRRRLQTKEYQAKKRQEAGVRKSGQRVGYQVAGRGRRLG